MDKQKLEKLTQLIRSYILTSTTAAGSGHPTSSLSAVELMATLFFGGYLHYDLANPHHIFNDRVIFSKGHASPLLYSLYAAAGVVSEQELLKLRQFDSPLQGHPVPEWKYADVATGSLGQGLSAGLGMALGIKTKIKDEGVKVDRIPHVWVLLGDSEFAEGQVWEALEVAPQYELNNLIGILDVNRLGQSGETMLGWNTGAYEKRISNFGWETVMVNDGNDLGQVREAFQTVKDRSMSEQRPTMIIAKTVKGKGVSILADKDNWHGKALPKDKLQEALKELGKIDKKIIGTIQKPGFTFLDSRVRNNTMGDARRGDPKTASSESDAIFGAVKQQDPLPLPNYNLKSLVATREAYGDGLVALGKINSSIIALDGETSNSTFSDKFKNAFPQHYFEMYIAEQNMVSTAVGLSKMQYIPFVSTFAAFLTRAFDQIRMAQYSEANIKLVGSHAGVSIGPDGASQMALEDIAMMRSILNSVIFYPSDAVSAYKLVEQMLRHTGITYFRSTREKTPVIYSNDEQFPMGGSKIVHESPTDKAVIFAAGITLHESLKAYEALKKLGINVAVVDLYSIKPIDTKTINHLASKTKHVIVVEDHYPAGGIGEAVKSSLNNTDVTFYHLAVNKIPRSGTPAELLRYEEIDSQAIVKTAKDLL